MSKFEQISPRLWIMHADHETDRPIIAAVVGERRTLLIDAGNSPQHAAHFRAYLQEQGVRPPDLLVLTHWHWDHTFGMAEWGLPSIAHQKTAEVLRGLSKLVWSEETLQGLREEQVISDSTIKHIRKEYGDVSKVRVIEPDIRFDGKLDVDLGGVTCEIRHVGGDHSSDSCYLYVPEEKVLFLGDALGPSVYGGPMKYTSEELLRLLRVMETYDAELFIESHSVPAARAAFLEELRPYKRLAELVGKIGKNRPLLAAELTNSLGVQALSSELEQAITFFLA